MLIAALFRPFVTRAAGASPMPASIAWTDAVIGAASLAALASPSCSWLTPAVRRDRIDAIKDLLQKDWFNWILAGLAFGGAHKSSVSAMESSHLAKAGDGGLAVLAPVLAVALAAFLRLSPASRGCNPYSGDADAAAVGGRRDPRQRSDR